MNTISVVISAFNEERKIRRSLESVQWADEIIVVDNNSTDKTVQIAKQYKAKIYSRTNNPMLNVNKNYGFEKSNCSWILNIDADEVIPEALHSEIIETLKTGSEFDGFWIPRKNIIFGKWIQNGLWWPDNQLRLFRRNRGKFPCLHVHEYIKVDGKTDNLVQPFIHFNYETVTQYIYKMDTIYTENEVANQVSLEYKLAWFDAIRFPTSDFLKIYFAQRGYRDGLHGLVLAILQSFYSFIVFAKLWEREKFNDIEINIPQLEAELKRSTQDYKYWVYTTKMQRTRNIVMFNWYRLLRKFLSKQ